MVNFYQQVWEKYQANPNDPYWSKKYNQYKSQIDQWVASNQPKPQPAPQQQQPTSTAPPAPVVNNAGAAPPQIGNAWYQEKPATTPSALLQETENQSYTPVQQAMYGLPGAFNSQYFSNAPVPPDAQKIYSQFAGKLDPYNNTFRTNIGNIVNNAMSQAKDIWGNAPQQIDLEQAKNQASASINRNLIRQQQQAARAMADAMGARGLAGSGLQAGATARQAADISRTMADAQANLADKYTGRELQQRGQDINIWGTKNSALNSLLAQGMGLKSGAESGIYGRQAGLLTSAMQMTPAMENLHQSAYWKPLHEAMGYQNWNVGQQNAAATLAAMSQLPELYKQIVSQGPQYAGVAGNLINSAYNMMGTALSNAMQMTMPQNSGNSGSDSSMAFGVDLGPFSFKGGF